MLSQSSLKQAAEVSARSPGPLLVDIVVLSGDLLLFHSVRAAVGERNPVWRARTAEEASDLLLTGRCGVLLLDTAAVTVEPAILISRIAKQFPDVVTVVAGIQDDETALSTLISSGLAYRFMHKPVSQKRAGLFLRAAMERHAERRTHRAAQPLASLGPAFPSPAGPLKWLLIATAVALVLATATIILKKGSGHRVSNPAPGVTQSQDAPTPSMAASTADVTLSRARAALDAGRLESPPGRNSLDLFSAVLLARPGHQEAAAGLERTVELIVQTATEQAEQGNRVEAWRLLSRAIQAAPENESVMELSARLEAEQREALATERRKAAGKPSGSSVPVAREGPSVIANDEAEQRNQATDNATEEQAAALRRAGIGPAGATTVATTENEPADPESEPNVRVEDTDGTAAGGPRSASAAVSTKSETPPTVMPDPLTPRRTNRASAQERPVSGLVRSGPRSYGAPISLGHPIAGYAEPEQEPLPTGDARVALTPLNAVSSGPRLVAASELVKIVSPEPVYPQKALRRGIQGWVEIEFTVDDTGHVRDMVVAGAEPRGVFDESAKNALAKWEFRPHLVDGRPVPQRTVLVFRFNVDG